MAAAHFSGILAAINQDILKPAVHATGLPQRTTFHALRHSHASAALGAGLPIFDLSRHLGHATAAETTDTYGHLLPKTNDRTRHTLEHLWNRDDPRVTQRHAKRHTKCPLGPIGNTWYRSARHSATSTSH